MEEEEDLDEVDSTTEIEIVLENLGEGGLVGVVAVVGGGRSESPMEEGTQRWHTVFGGGSDLGVLGTHLDKDDVYWADLAGLVVSEVGVRRGGSDLADGGGVGGAGERERKKKKINMELHMSNFLVDRHETSDSSTPILALNKKL